MTKPIRGKIAGLITSNRVALNIGSEAGVKVGMRFQILSTPIGIKDPDSGEKIGTVTISKGKVSVYEVGPKYSLAETYATVGVVTSIPSFLRGPKIEGLNVDPSDLLESDEPVRVGDLVSQIGETM